MLALVDGDIVAFRCASSAERDEEAFIPLSRTKDLIESILADVRADSFRIYLTHSDRNRNFRRKLYPAYKQQRDSKPSPRWLSTCREYLINEWGAEICDGYEADDGLGIEQCRGTGETVICTIDKDLRQVPGRHFNFVTKQHSTVDPAAGIRTFYTQCLVGDPTDNIKGCEGIGKVKAPKMLEGDETEEEMFATVRLAYNNDKNLLLNGKLLWILREKGGIWNPPQLAHVNLSPVITTEQGQEVQPVSTQPTAEAGIP